MVHWATTCLAWVALIAAAAHALGHGAVYVGPLSGAAQWPANDSPGTGFAVVSIDFDLFTMRIELEFSGLLGDTASARIHGPTFPALGGTADTVTLEPSLPSFSTGVTSGAYDGTLDLALAASYSPAFLARFENSVSRASNALFFGLDEGRMYLNVATSAYPGGEIRGFLQATPVADFTHNGVVDGADLPVWRDAYFVAHHGDANHDDFTTGDDFLVWQQQLGAVAAVGAHQHSAVAAPEPASIVLTALAVIAVGRPWKRTNCREIWLHRSRRSAMISTVESLSV